MNSLTESPVADLLSRLFDEADAADRTLLTERFGPTQPGIDPVAGILQAEAEDYKSLYRQVAGNFLSVTPEFGRFLYICVRARNARCVVEFGTSFGISTIHLGCAVRDNGGGTVISTELEHAKASRALEHLAVAGLTDYVTIRVGDALETLRDGVGAPVDVVHLDGAFRLYRPVLELLEPHLQRSALILAENGTSDYLEYVQDPSNGYLSLTLPVDAQRGNEISLFVR